MLKIGEGKDAEEDRGDGSMMYMASQGLLNYKDNYLKT